MTTPETTQEGGQFKPAVNRSELLDLLPKQEAKVSLPETIDYRDRATDIAETISRFQSAKGLKDALDIAKKAYVGEEDDPQMRRFSGILCDARRARQATERLDELNKIGAGKTPDERAEAHKLLSGIVSYDHAIRQMIVDSRGELGNQDLTDFLSRASGGDENWAKRRLTGIAGEVAVYKTLAEIDGIGVAWGTPKEDMHNKTDILVTILANGRKIRVDAKFGGTRIEDVRIVKYDLVEVGAAKIDMQDDFSLKEAARQAIQKQFMWEVIR
jgi:hypothetical protein